VHVSTTTTPIDVDTQPLRERKKQQTRQTLHEVTGRLVAEHGLANVTIDSICVEANVSSRTFFNYFPSKSAAALGLPGARIDDDFRARFCDGSSLVADLCDLVAGTMGLRAERERLKELVMRRPELVPAMMQWAGELRAELIALAAERTDEETARRAVTLVLAALMELVHHSSVDSREAIAASLRAEVAALGTLAASV
jgi:AcrR family transcriptional regulator